MIPFNWLGTKYKHFAKFQNLIDLAYVQLTTNQTIWPLFTTEENPEKNPNFNDPQGMCRENVLRKTITGDVWVRKKPNIEFV